LSTLAARLAALDRRIDPETRADLAKVSNGRTLAGLANALIDAIDPDKVETAAREKHGADAFDAQRVAIEAMLKDDACKPFDTPQLAKL
jgi:type I restriction enzyme, R subunit